MDNAVSMFYALMHDSRNMLRVHRRQLRDATDPFDIPEERFHDLYRLSKDAAMDLLNEVSPFMKSGVRTTFIPKNIKLVVALHFYATGSFMRDVGQDFLCSVSKTMVCRIIHEVTSVIERKLMDKYVKFPRTREEMRAIQNRFFTCTGFPGVIGAIDCTHVKIKKPSIDVEHCYKNRKGFFSKNVQLICDYDLTILGCYARYGGNTHDAYIWDNSLVRTFLERECSENTSNAWLLGDSGYPLQPWLMIPFRNPGNGSQEKYNECHILARNCVERLNGVLKKVFACLSEDRGLLVSPLFSGSIVNVCCTLHNFRKKYNLPMPDVTVEEESTSEIEFEHIAPNVSNNRILNEGRRVRHIIVRNYFPE